MGLGDCQKGQAVDPLFEETQLLLVAAYRACGDLQDALKMLTQVYEAREKRTDKANPSDEFLKVQLMLAKMYFATKKVDDGIKLFEAYIKTTESSRGKQH